MKNLIRLLCILLLITGCSSNNDNEKTNNVSNNEQIIEETEENFDEAVKLIEENNDSTELFDDTMVVGEDGKGYVEVPSNWVKFTDESGSGSFQYSSSNMSHIITLDKIVWSEEVPVENQTAEAVANNYFGYFESTGITKIQGAMVNYDNIDKDVYEIYGYYDNEQSIWIVDVLTDENGDVYFVSIEGLFNEDILNIYNLIVKTYNFTK
jgi:thioredoxin-related protein